MNHLGWSITLIHEGFQRYKAERLGVTLTAGTISDLYRLIRKQTNEDT